MAVDRSSQGDATLGSVANDQADKQRDAFAGTTGTKGAFRRHNSPLVVFDITSRGTGAEIMVAARNLMSYKTGNGTGSTPAAGENPDFPAGISAGQMLFTSGDDKLSTTTDAIDNPNLFGPNISVNGDLLDNPSANGSATASPGTQKASNDDSTAVANYDTKGFGVSISRNDPRRNNSTSNRFLDNRASSEGTKLGEYLDSATYEYEE